MKRVLGIVVGLLWILAAVLPAAGCAESIPDGYSGIMELYRRGLAGDEEVLFDASEQFNYAAYQCCLDWGIDPASSVGYAVMDLDGDGTEELLIADATEDQKMEGIVFDVWTLVDGQPVLLLRGWDRYRLYLTAQDERGSYGFYREGSSSAFDSTYEQGRFYPSEARTEHVLEYNEENTDLWQLDGKGVDEGTAYATINEWSGPVIRIGLSPISMIP